MRINFFGDIVAPDCNMSMSEDLKQLLCKGDINVINYEAPSIRKNDLEEFTPIKKSGPSLYQSPDLPTWLEDNGFTLASLANNHTMDYGEKGLYETFKCFKKIQTFGAGSWDKAYEPVIIEVDNKKVAFLALTHCEFGTLTDKWDSKHTVGSAWINHPDVDDIIIKTRKTVDLLFVFAHAGVEHISQPLPEWRDRYRSFIDIGCDAVIASHPHIVQGYEIYNNKPIVYSLGNFYFPKPVKKHDSWYQSLCASVICDETGVHLETTPIVFNDNNIKIDTSDSTLLRLNQINNVLSDEKLYLEEINEICSTMLNTYYCMFESGGLVKTDFFRMVKYVVRKFLRNRKVNIPTLINNLRCESHRYCITRALKLKENIM